MIPRDAGERRDPVFEILLINILFLILPVLAYVIFFDNRRDTHFNIYSIIFSTFSMILCMVYPIHLQMGFIFDLRYIPFLIIALYGGYKMVLPLYIVLNIYRFIIGGEGTLQSLLFSTTIFLLVPWISKKFAKYNAQKRILVGISAAVFTMGLYLVTLSTFFDEITQAFWILVFYSMTTHIIVITINIMMIEKVISNIKNREKFLHTERLHVMSELSASVSHEIRNPLTVTKGFLQLLKESDSTTADDKIYLDYSLNELERAEKILNDFLAFAKPQSENMVYSNLEEEVEYVINILMPYARMNQVDIQSQFTNSLRKKYDKNQMQQCLINIMKNGIESMKETGGILSISVSEENRNIVMKIKDNGNGMTNDEISQLGKPYYSTKTEGTGLGMLMVYGTISQVKGQIEVESKKRKGTTFTITLPV